MRTEFVSFLSAQQCFCALRRRRFRSLGLRPRTRLFDRSKALTEKLFHGPRTSESNSSITSASSLSPLGLCRSFSRSLSLCLSPSLPQSSLSLFLSFSHLMSRSVSIFRCLCLSLLFFLTHTSHMYLRKYFVVMHRFRVFHTEFVVRFHRWLGGGALYPPLRSSPCVDFAFVSLFPSPLSACLCLALSTWLHVVALADLILNTASACCRGTILQTFPYLPNSNLQTPMHSSRCSFGIQK